MQKGSALKLTALILVAVIAIGLFALLQSYKASDQQLSIKPEMYFSEIKLEPLVSHIGIQAAIPFSTIIHAAEKATAENQTGDGKKRTCKKVLGAKVCATLQWQYSIGRDGEVELVSSTANANANANADPTLSDTQLQLRLPIKFAGLVSVDGRGGKLLGLRNKDISGKLKLIADLNVNIGSDWCPEFKSQVSYEWLSDPKIRLVGDIRLNLRKSVDKSLRKKLADLQNKLSQIVDCNELRQEIKSHWHTHQIKVSMTDGADSWMHVKPIGASTSDIDITNDSIVTSFELAAIVELLQNSLVVENAQDLVELPALESMTQTPGTVEFSLLMELPYQQLAKTLSARLIGKTYGNSSSLTITSLELYPSGELLTIDLGFDARATGMLSTSGNLYISARPIADPISNTLRLADIDLTRAIDSRLMTALTTILREQLLAELKKASVIDLTDSLAKIEYSIADTLADPDKTAGLEITAAAPDVRLMALNPQADGIAAIIHLSTRLNAKVSEGVLVR